MILLEEDALWLWCPKTSREEFKDLNSRDEEIPRNLTCIGSYCMLWVWKNEEYAEKSSEDEKFKLKGYCGLRAKP